MVFSSSSETFPFNIYTFADLQVGLSPPLMICKHSSNEFALWSNCPGKNSTANTLSFWSNV